MLVQLGLDEGYSTLRSTKGSLQHLWQDFILWGKGCIFGAKAVGTAVRCDREVRLQHLSFSCSIFNLWVHVHGEVAVLAFRLFCLSAKPLQIAF